MGIGLLAFVVLDPLWRMRSYHAAVQNATIFGLRGRQTPPSPSHGDLSHSLGGVLQPSGQERKKNDPSEFPPAGHLGHA